MAKASEGTPRPSEGDRSGSKPGRHRPKPRLAIADVEVPQELRVLDPLLDGVLSSQSQTGFLQQNTPPKWRKKNLDLGCDLYPIASAKVARVWQTKTVDLILPGSPALVC